MRVTLLLFLTMTALTGRLLSNQDTIMILNNAPIWTSVRTDDERAGRLVCEALRSLLKKEPAELRAELVKYVGQFTDGNADQLGALSRIFILNRMFFKVPAQERMDAVEFFGGWNGIPHGSGKVDMMWPVKMDRSGNFSLAGYFCGYFGPEYRALEEFDFFWKKYGKRELPKESK